MKKLLILSSLSILFCICIACEDDNKVNVKSEWQYSEPYFEFEYITDTISFGSANNQMIMSSQDLKNMFFRFAGMKMKEYFKGIHFSSTDSLIIKAQKASGETMSIRANYLKDRQYFEISLHVDDMKTLIGEGAAMIPPISFKYLEQDGKMIIYFNEVYLQSLFENTQIQNMLMPIIGRALNPQFDRMPAMAQKAMLAGIQKQLSTIIDQITILKIGFIME